MRKDLLAAALAGAVILLFGREILLEHASPFRGDIPVQFYPWKVFTRDMLASGEIPYWNPYAYGGAPFLANMQSAVFYPLDWALFVFPPEWFFGLSLLLHLSVAALGAYRLARIGGASSFPAAIAAIAYSLNGFTMIHIPAGNHLTYAGAAWAPWMFWAAAGFVFTQGSRLPWALATAGIVTLHFLCGHPQMMFYSLVFAFLFCLILGIFVERGREQPNPAVPVLRTGAWTIFTLLGLALAGMQLVPTLEYLREANRAASLDLAMATEFSFAPHRLVTLFCPEYYGTFIAGNHYDSFVYWSCAYAGVIVPVLAVCAFAARKRFPVVIPLMIVGGLGLLLAWGRGNPVYTVLFHLPGFGHFRAPAKFLPYYLVPVCTLAALAVEWISERTYEAQQAKKESAPPFFYGISLAVLAALLVFYGVPALERLTELMHQTDGAHNPEAIRSYAIARAGLIAVAGLAAFLLARRIPRYPRIAISLSLALVLAVDLIPYSRPYLLASLRRPDAIRKSIAPPQEIGFIRSQMEGRPERVATLAEIGYPNLFILWKISNLAGYDPMSLRSYNRLIGATEGWKEDAFHDNIPLRKTDGPALDLLNVRYILTLQSLTGPGLRQAFAGPDFQVYERTSEKRAWASIRAASDIAPSEITWTPVDSQIEIQQYSPHEIVWALSWEHPAVLRVAEWHYPGWKAEALKSGQWIPVMMEPSPEGLRVLRLPEGVSRVRMVYRAPWLGWVLSVGAAFLFLLLAGWVLITRTDRHLALLQRIMGRYY